MAEPMKAAAVRPAESLAALREAAADPKAACLVLTYASSARAEEPHFFELGFRALAEAAKRQEIDVEAYDAQVPGFDARALYASLTTRGLFSKSTVRFVKNTEALWKGARGAEGEEDSGAGAGEKAPARSREAAIHPIERAALTFVKGAAPGERLVLAGAKFRAPFLRAVREAGGRVFEFRPLYDKPFRGTGPVESTELGDFVKGMARDAGVKLGAGALGALVARTGNQLGAVDAALQKLASVRGTTEIAAADVEAQIPLTRPGSPWALSEAILLGDAPAALREMRLLARFGARDADGKAIALEGALTMALAALVRDARRNRDAARRVRAGESLDAVARGLGVPPFPAAMDAFAGAVKARTPAAHGRLVRFLLETELAVRVEREPLLSAMQRLAARARVGAPRRRAGSVP